MQVTHLFRLRVTRKRPRFGGRVWVSKNGFRKADMEGESQTHRKSLHGDELTTDVTCNIVLPYEATVAPRSRCEEKGSRLGQSQLIAGAKSTSVMGWGDFAQSLLVHPKAVVVFTVESSSHRSMYTQSILKLGRFKTLVYA